MKNIFAIILLTLIVNSDCFAQEKKVGWFITPEFGAMLLDDHVGYTSGASLGITLWKNRIKLGIYTYGRSGPINPQTFTVEASAGQTYKGSSTLTLRADQLSFGGFIAPTFSINNWDIDVPLSIGTMGAGFYFAGDDRITPDGARVSVWEDKLMDGKDAGFGNYFDFGLRCFIPSKNPDIKFGVGMHYTMVNGWSTYYDPTGEFYNNKFRFTLSVNFNPKS
jgi:hypothetical protein